MGVTSKMLNVIGDDVADLKEGLEPENIDFWFRKIISVKLLRPFLVITLLIGLLFIAFEQFDVHHIIASVISIIVIPFVAWNTRIIKIGELSWVKEKLIK